MRTSKNYLVAGAIALLPIQVFCQYTHPTTFINGEYVGACLVSTCGPDNYFDNGGSGGNYANNINNIYRVFCPSTAGNCMRVTFNAFNTENNFDWLLIGNGPTQNSPLFTTPPANGLGRIMGTPAVPFTYTSTDASGCLTFRFRSDNSINRPGWSAVLQCTPCAGGPNGTDNNDCSQMTALCSGAAVTTNSSGPGIAAEGCTGSACPAGGENHTNWYTFAAQTTGTLTITLTPTVMTDDYDFAIYGPNVTCAALGAPIRCTDSGLTGVTGLTGAAGDFVETVTGDSYLQTLNVVAGQQYILVVDKWSPSGGTGYTLNFGGTSSLDCTILPVELSEFSATYVPDQGIVDLFWATATERDNDHFDVEKSIDGINFEVINQVNGMGTTLNETQYYVIDEHPAIGVNYYRLNQFDINGDSKYSEVRSVNILDEEYDQLSVFPNPSNGMTELIFNSYMQYEAVINVSSADGRVIINTPVQLSKGGNRFNLDLSNNQHGVYIVSVVAKEKVYKTKLILE